MTDPVTLERITSHFTLNWILRGRWTSVAWGAFFAPLTSFLGRIGSRRDAGGLLN